MQFGSLVESTPVSGHLTLPILSVLLSSILHSDFGHQLEPKLSRHYNKVPIARTYSSAQMTCIYKTAASYYTHTMDIIIVSIKELFLSHHIIGTVKV